MKGSNRLKNEKGSVLAYVLIFGMVIMALVAGLLTVANSGISFTQQSVESRQAYIDAKSVIEFGKIEINSWKIELTEAYEEYVAVLNDKDSTSAEIQSVKAEIAVLENKTASIYGDENNVATSLSLTESDDKNILGNVLIKKNEESAGETDTYQYTFYVETRNLRRKLAYQVECSYAVADESDLSDGDDSTDTTPSSDPKLEGEFYFFENYVLNNDDGKTTLEVKEITFDGDLTLESGADLEIKCDILHIKGNLEVGSNAGLNINAGIVMIDGDFILGPEAGNVDKELAEGFDSSLEIKTEYFDCSGATLIDNLKDNFYIRRIDYSKPLYVRFGGGYEQTPSDSGYGVTIGEEKDKQDNNKSVTRNATMIVFGGEIIIPEDGVYLNLMADSIYFDSDDIQVEDSKNFIYSSESVVNDKVNFFIKSDLTEDRKQNDIIHKGSHYEAKGSFPMMLDDKEPPDYIPPDFPDPPGTGRATVIASTGLEKYY